jgi:hypothetical protein
VIWQHACQHKTPATLLEGRQDHNLWNGFPVVPPVRTGFQCGLFPAASGSFAGNAHNGGISVTDLGVDGVSNEAGTAGNSVGVRVVLLRLVSRVLLTQLTSHSKKG